MIRPATCLSLVAALGSGLYLYQEKYSAQLLDREITRTVKQAEQGRDRIGLLRAEWALLTEPARLSDLASHHLQLQSMQLSQFAKVEDLPNRLPAPAAVTTAAEAMDEPPDAPAAVAVAVAAPAKPVPPAIQPSPAQKPAPVQLAVAHIAPKPAAPRTLAAFKPPEHEAAEPMVRASYAPIAPTSYAPAYTPASYAPVPRAPVMQTASVQTGPFVGSALGMARTMPAAPVPVAATPGYADGR